MSRTKNALLFSAFMFLLIVAEIACAKLAWHTVGEIYSALLLFLVGLNLAPILAYFLKWKKLAVGLALLGGLLSIPPQLFLGYRWHILRQETLNIVAYVEKTKKQTGSYPQNLSAYAYFRPTLKQDITYKRYKPDDYALSFHVGSPNTEHWYETGSGWYYYPD